MVELECDYLIVGAGAVGMSFVDTLLDESQASVVMIDKHHVPGGHWNDAYPFVRLHQPSHFYGVTSTELGTKRIDQTGSNAGYFELASGNEVQSYFERIMRERFLPSGRVQYFPMSEYLGDHQFRNLLSNECYSVKVRERVVDSTYFQTSVPSRHKPNFTVAPDAQCIPPNELPLRAQSGATYCVLGAGKTAMDTLVWLLDNGAEPQDIHWVCPRASWMINRDVTQASVEFFKQSIGGFAAQMQALAEATSVEDLFARLEACGFMIRIDTSQFPEMFHYATISVGEVEQLRRIEQVIAEGRVSEVRGTGLLFANQTEVALPEDTLYIDCTASAVNFHQVSDRPVYEDGLITIQPTRMPNPCLSAAIAAYVEFNYDDDVKRNQLSTPVQLPDSPKGFMRSTLGNMMNQVAWSNESGLSEFVNKNRLDGFGAVIAAADLTDPENAEIMERLQRYGEPAVANLWKLLSE